MTEAARPSGWRRAMAGMLGGVAVALATGAVPVLTAIDPPGLTVGETADWTATGRALARVERFLISGTGVEAVAIEPDSDESIRLRVRAAADALPGFRELRADGPAGTSNLLLFRLDHLPQSREAEPNDTPESANPLAWNSAVAGALQPQDVDHFAFQGRAGRRVAIEVEARRLGSPVVPVARLLAPSGASLARSQPMRDGGGDCRLVALLPADGRYGVEVRDALYRGGASARYRLRIDDGPFATGLFPLGGPRGETITVSVSGGNLGGPWRKTVNLPDEPGATVEPGAIDGPGGSVLAPGRLVVGDGPEVVESADGESPTRLPFDATANGRIDRPGEVDRYAVAVRPGETVRVEVQAAALGSWLDSLVTLDDAHGSRIGEDDDGGDPNRPAGRLVKATADSRLDIEAPADGALVVAITDRFGDGGPEYAYRLRVGPPRPDFAVTLRPVASEALNLAPGSSVPIRFQIAADGRPGPITVRAEGLPPGVTAQPVTIRLPRAVRGLGGAPVEGTLILNVEPAAPSRLGWLRVVATARAADAGTLTRRATATLVLAPAAPGDFRPPPARVISEFPVRVVAPAPR